LSDAATYSTHIEEADNPLGAWDSEADSIWPRWAATRGGALATVRYSLRTGTDSGGAQAPPEVWYASGWRDEITTDHPEAVHLQGSSTEGT
jgi:hypothetical protein